VGGWAMFRAAARAFVASAPGASSMPKEPSHLKPAGRCIQSNAAVG